jgi:hypothetical protein
MRSENGCAGGILHEMEMERDDPASARELPRGSLEALHEKGRYHTQGVREGKMRFRIRIEEHDAQAVVRRRRDDHRKGVVPDLGQLMGKPDSSLPERDGGNRPDPPGREAA